MQTVTLLAVTWLMIVNAKRYHIEKLDERPGLYFVKQNLLLLATESWTRTIAVDTNLKELEEKLTQLENIWKVIIRLKNESVEAGWTDAQFQETRAVMKHTNIRVQRLYEILGAGSGPARKRRGLFNTVGFGLKTLFGTMDHDDAEYFNEKLSTLDLNQNRVYQLEQNQLTLVRHTLSEVKHTFKDFKTNQDTIIKMHHYLAELLELEKSRFDTFEQQINLRYRMIGALQIIDLACRDIDRLVTELY